MKLVKSLLAASFLAASMQVAAAPVVIGQGNEKSLQQVLNDITVGGNSSVNVNTDQVNPDEIWELRNTASAFSEFVVEIAGGRNTNTFGIYDIANPNTKLELFSGSQGASNNPNQSRRGFQFWVDSNGKKYFTAVGGATVEFSSQKFGFYLGTQNQGTMYSQAKLNQGGADQSVAFRGKGDRVSFNGVSRIWGQDAIILGFEDLIHRSDRDYNDMVVMVNSVSVAVSEPASMALFGLGLAGLGFARRKQSKA